MSITLLLFAHCREAAGRAALELDIQEETTIPDLWAAIERACPALGRFRASSRIAVNREFASERTRIVPGDEVALIPPVSGG